MTNSKSTYTFAQLRERALSQDINVLADAGLLSEDTIEYLTGWERNYEHNPHDPDSPYYVQNTDRWQQIVRKEVSKNLRKAVKQGRYEEVAHAVGLQGETHEAGEMITWERTRSRFDGPGSVLVYGGQQGGGKTTHALKMSNLQQHMPHDVIVLTNIKSVAEANDGYEYVWSVDSLLDSVDKYSEDYDRIIFIFDEASSHATFVNNQGDVGKFGNFCRKLRKQGIDIFVIGHRVVDIAPTIRKLPGADFVLKPDKSTAEWYSNPNDADERENVDLMHENLSDTELVFETEEYTTWSWDGLDRLEEQEEPDVDAAEWDTKVDRAEGLSTDAQIEALNEETNMSYRSIAEEVGVSKSQVGRVLDD